MSRDMDPDVQNISIKCSNTIAEEALDEKTHFYIELKKYYTSQSDNSTKREWSLDRVQEVIKLIEEYKSAKIEGQHLTGRHYHHSKKYDVLVSDNTKILVTKGKAGSPPLKIIPSEEYYDLIKKIHEATGHGGRDKIRCEFRDKYLVVPIFCISIFLNVCKICKSKRSKIPLGTKISDFNRRGLIRLLDLQATPDNDFTWLLNYQDEMTRFCLLRPLKSDEATEVAAELLKIFLEMGCPHILHSNISRDFTSSVIKKLMQLWPTCKILNGKTRQPCAKDSSSENELKKNLQAWMAGNKTKNWSLGCYFVQFQHNSLTVKTTGKSPYRSLFGLDPITGLSSSALPAAIIAKLNDEEDLEEFFEQQKEDAAKDDTIEILLEPENGVVWEVGNDSEEPEEPFVETCNTCKEPLTGVLYVCLQCDYRSCGGCDADGAHQHHYVMRAPATRTQEELEKVMEKVREVLQQVPAQAPPEQRVPEAAQTDEDEEQETYEPSVMIKTEIEIEEQDPFAPENMHDVEIKTEKEDPPEVEPSHSGTSHRRPKEAPANDPNKHVPFTYTETQIELEEIRVKIEPSDADDASGPPALYLSTQQADQPGKRNRDAAPEEDSTPKKKGRVKKKTV